MAYSKAAGRATLKYDKMHYKKITVKVPLETFAQIEKLSRFKNVNQFINMLIADEIKRENDAMGISSNTDTETETDI